MNTEADALVAATGEQLSADVAKWTIVVIVVLLIGLVTALVLTARIVRGITQPLGLGTVVGERIVEIALDEAAADRPGRRVHPDMPRVTGDEGLRKGDQLGALVRGLLDQADGLVDRGVEVEPGRRRLHHRHLVFRMFDAHCRLHCRLIASHVRCSLFGKPERQALDRGGTKTRLDATPAGTGFASVGVPSQLQDVKGRLSKCRSSSRQTAAPAIGG